MLNVNLLFIHFETSMLPEEDNSCPTVLSLAGLLKTGEEMAISYLLSPPETTDWSEGAFNATGLTKSMCETLGYNYNIFPQALPPIDFTSFIPVVWGRRPFEYSEYRLLGKKVHGTTMGKFFAEEPLDLKEYVRSMLMISGADNSKYNSGIERLSGAWRMPWEPETACCNNGTQVEIRPMATTMRRIWQCVTNTMSQNT